MSDTAKRATGNQDPGKGEGGKGDKEEIWWLDQDMDNTSEDVPLYI